MTVRRINIVAHTHYDVGYTDHPAVTETMQCRALDRALDLMLRTEDFPKKNTFRLDASKLSRGFLRRCKPETPEDEVMYAIQRIYMQGREFNGKCVRSAKTWLELFAEPEHEWRLEDRTYFLYRKDRLLEAYSADPKHPVCQFIPVQGGHDSNKLMLNLQGCTGKLADTIGRKALLFPIADTF